MEPDRSADKAKLAVNIENYVSVLHQNKIAWNR